MNRPGDTSHKLWRSVGFRLAAHYALLVGLTVLTALAILYLQTVGALHQRMARQVHATAQQLSARFEAEGAEAVVHAIEQALVDGRSTDEELLLLADAQGRRLAGNLDAAPPADTAGQRQVMRMGQSVRGWVTVKALPQGHVLVVGQDLAEQADLEDLILHASAAAALLTLLLLAGGIALFRQELDRSVGAVRRTARRIAAGNLQERVPQSSQGDEFALLEQDINGMLDRIESLMDGVRHVSDTIAHNLRTPLTRILTRLHAASGDGIGGERQQAAITAAIGELEELNRVFGKLLQIAEAEVGAQRTRFGLVPLHTIADDAVELYEALAEAQGATLLRGPREALHVHGDRDLLAGVAANLVDNALKHGGANAIVRVSTCTLAGGALLTVQDDGPGVPADMLGRLGTRFLRLQPDVAGQGLGLASVHAVVALHGGRIRYEDARPGLRVCVTLPRAPGPH